MNAYDGWSLTNGKRISFPNGSKYFYEQISDKDLKKSRKHRLMTVDQSSEYVLTIEEGIKHKQIINEFQNWLISTKHIQNLEIVQVKLVI